MLFRCIILGAAIWFTPEVKTWIWYHVPAWLQMASWAVSGYLWVGGTAVILFGLPLLQKASSPVRGNIWNTGPGRWVIGRFAEALVVFGLPALAWLLASPFSSHAWTAGLSAFLAVIVGRRRVKIFIGRASAPLRRVLREWRFGRGGSARISGILDDWAHPWSKS